ncbi:MAG TPA: glycosyltransferase family 2 protein [Ktedonobacterales bacterium]
MRDATMWLLNRLWLVPHLTAMGALALLSLRLWSNFRFLRRARERAQRLGGVLPRVSVLVPARNEAGTIVDCVTSLLDQGYPNLEILVLDDDSTDGAGELLDALQQRAKRLTVLHRTGAPPAGWNGKSYACDVLARHASGEWLLFTDADTHHEPDSVARGIAYAAALSVDFVSVFPYQIASSWSERLLVSFLLDFLPLVTVNLPALARGRATRVAANGQYLLMNAASYRAVGGHASVKGELIDDFALARRFQAGGYRIALIQGGGMLSCRMYHSAGEVWRGFSKNLLGALDAPLRWRAFLWGPLFAWLYACLFILPFTHLTLSQQWGLAMVEILWLLLLRAMVVWRLKRPPDEILTTPLAAWGVMALGMAALVRRWRNAPVVWKGRAYAS